MAAIYSSYPPKEILITIFAQLDPADLLACQMTCKIWHHCISENSDAFYRAFAQRVSYFFRRDAESYYNDEGKVKEHFILDYKQVLGSPKHVMLGL